MPHGKAFQSRRQVCLRRRSFGRPVNFSALLLVGFLKGEPLGAFDEMAVVELAR
jgi:hypothetical protein